MWSTLRFLTCAVGLLGLATAAVMPAAPPAAAQQQSLAEHQVELTTEMVEAFLDTYPQIEALGEEFEQQYGHAGADPEDPTGFAMAYARYAEARQRMESILAAHGIGSMEQWAQIAYSVMIAYSFAETGENIGGMDAEMAEAIEQIRGDASIPEAHRQQMIAALEAQMAQLRQLRPSPGNIALVSEYAGRIRAVVDDGEEE